MSLYLTSSAFESGAAIPSLYTCQGQDISPPLSWAGVPSGTASLVLIIDDPDAPDPAAPKMTWVHWVVFNLPPDVNGLEAAATLPAGAAAGLNDWKVFHYKGPCPPVGTHRYFHKLYALDIVLDGLRNPTKAQVEAVMVGHILDHAALVGTYRKA